ncbi:LOW QUALITY PROTEIN: brain-specific angiogenesis inhibitor 1-associated protein 2-like protein 1 [Tupaia chinensis]|uniref:LOW QUALITY PROTEIN: brain-specific angiogenesis inhibitor 1-associated protein 2-like protein 1 n=1 Tax=Tupaia chinensis TaxID=246437 RepID=UPI000704064D|nr:LOW QUALITY PROTEIN: brain-specific angiogenesis inhibitor 1-associated protein 2-like protein 1 [Tupaia chinensis]
MLSHLRSIDSVKPMSMTVDIYLSCFDHQEVQLTSHKDEVCKGEPLTQGHTTGKQNWIQDWILVLRASRKITLNALQSRCYRDATWHCESPNPHSDTEALGVLGVVKLIKVKMRAYPVPTGLRAIVHLIKGSIETQISSCLVFQKAASSTASTGTLGQISQSLSGLPAAQSRAATRPAASSRGRPRGSCSHVAGGPEEVSQLTENTYRNVMEQFNPGLRNLINLGKNYEKAVTAMILAGKAYHDGVAKIGEFATGSPVSTELGHVLIEISSTHKKLSESLDENVKRFHKEIIHELEKKTELDVKYMNATLKRSYLRTVWSQPVTELSDCSAFLRRPGDLVAVGLKLSVELELLAQCAFMVQIKQAREGNSADLCSWQSGNADEEWMVFWDLFIELAWGLTFSEKITSTFILTDTSEDPSLQRSVSVATGLNMMKKPKVKTIFPHTAGTNKTLLSFAQGDVITLLILEEKDGWLYGEHDTTKARGWFPSSYTKLLEESAQKTVTLPMPSPAPVRNVSTMNLAEKSSVIMPPPDYLECLSMGAAAEKRVNVTKNTSTFKAPVSKPEAISPNHANGTAKPPFDSGANPFATVKLRPTVTNDRSAPIIR